MLQRVLSRYAGEGLIGRVSAALTEVAERPGRMTVCLLLSLSVQSMFVALNCLLGRSVGVDVPLQAWAVAWPLSKLIAIAPVSLAGLGVREGLLVAFLTPLGAASGQVFTAGILWETVLVAGGLSGLAVITATGQFSHQWASGRAK